MTKWLNKVKEIFKNNADSNQQYEECINCGAYVWIDKETHLVNREHYIEGAGQLCEKCYKKIYETNIVK